MTLTYIQVSNTPYIISFALFCISLYGILISQDRFKKILCLGLLQTASIIFFMILSKVDGNKVPFVTHPQEANLSLLANPLPHVLMLTAIVVSVATLAVGLALIIKIKNK
ncbi:MAG: cation:proton antiporter subunit C [Rickettsiales bacterium]|nr:cation:proton antiporter subunit C [Rickettsiales bacterium]